MKLHFTVSENAKPLYEGDYEITDGISFGRACTDIWLKLAERGFRASGSVGAVYEAIGDSLLVDLNGVQLAIARTD